MTKRFSSRSIKIGPRIAASVAAALATNACSEREERGHVYHNVEDCVQDKVFTPDFCQQQFRAAAAEHLRTAPHYDALSDCRDDWSDCEPGGATNGTSAFFMPRTQGFWSGYYLGQGNSRVPEDSYAHPVYKTAGGAPRSLNAESPFSGYGKTTVRQAVTGTASGAALHESFTPGQSFKASGVSVHSAGSSIHPATGLHSGTVNSGRGFVSSGTRSGGFGGTGHGFGSGS